MSSFHHLADESQAICDICEVFYRVYDVVQRCCHACIQYLRNVNIYNINSE